MEKRIGLIVSTLVILLLIANAVYSQQELKICALRVSFQEDQNSLTTGNGLFMMDTTDVDLYTVDPAPHNRSYFQDQIIAVKNYYLAASKGQLRISGTVFPVEQDTSYQLSNEMGYYNPNTTDEENDLRLAELMIDAIKMADSDPDVDFSQFDLVTIFHAGVGKDIDVGFDETPQDIPSLYLSLDFFKKVYGDTFSGISVDNGTKIIESGIILPETETQVDFQLALTGIFAANIGSHLGMYDMFSATEQVTGIGQFGLMDVGQFNAFGLLPAMPSAFSRKIVGWDIPVAINTPQESIQVKRYRGRSNQNQTCIKIPINSDEYYLLEYRGDRNVNIDSLYFEISENRTDIPSYLEVLRTYLSDNVIISDSTGVVLKVDDYDWGLPGSGILIWHVDEKVIAEKGPINRINDDPDNRAVDLEEADGSQDIGYSYGITHPGYQSELGTWLDFWFDMTENRPLYKNRFAANTSPNSRSNRNNANTHIILENFSNNYSDVMTFDFRRDFFETGFPVVLSTNQNITFGSLKGFPFTTNQSVLVSSDNQGNIYAVTSQGKGFLADSLYLIAQLPIQEKTEQVLGDSDNDSFMDKLFITSGDGWIFGFDLDDLNNDNFVDLLWSENTGSAIINSPVIYDSSLFIATAESKIIEFNLNGDKKDSLSTSTLSSDIVVVGGGLNNVVYSSQTVFAPIVVDINSDTQLDTLFFPDSNKIEIELANHGKKSFQSDQKMIAEPAIADIDLDGYYEIVYNSEKLIYAINYNGAVVTNMPFSPVLQEGEKLIGTPLVADVNNDDMIDIISITNQGQIFALSMDGHALNGFPASAGGNILHTPLLIDIDQDQNLELFSINNKGQIQGWQFDEGYTLDLLWWTQESFSPQNNRLINRSLNPAIPAFSELMPSKKVYNYPNPNIENYTNIRYFLTEESDVNVKIFDLAGDMVDSFNGPGNAGIDQEIKWDVSDIQSGVYLCRVEAKSASKSDVRIIKIMVIH